MKKKISVLFGAGFWLLLAFSSCTEDPPPKLSYVERQYADSLYKDTVQVLKTRMDSLCEDQFDAMVTRRMRIIASIGILLLIGLLFPSFQKKNRRTKDQLIQERLISRIDEYKRTMRKKCIKNALEIASVQVDSILLSQAKLNRSAIDKPDRPDKPGQPNVKTPKDSIEAKPIFEGQ